MTDPKPRPDPAPEPVREPEADPPAMEAEGEGDIVHRDRRKAPASLVGPVVAPAAAGAVTDADARLDDRSETEAALARASGTPD